MMRRSQPKEIPTSLQQAFNDIRADYDASKNTRFRRQRTGVSSVGSGADYHVRNDSEFIRMIELARDFQRNDPIVGQGVTRLKDNVMRSGIVLDPQTKNEDANAYIRERWTGWSEDPESCDRSGENDLNTMASTAFEAMIVDGDYEVLPTTRGSIEGIEAHRLRTPSGTRKNVVHGVLMDQHRRRLEYWFTKEDIGLSPIFKRVGDMRRIRARDPGGHKQVFHIRNPKRTSQTRGVSAFAPIADMIGMHSDVQFAHLVAAQVASCFVIFREREAGLPGGLQPDTGEQTAETLADGTVRIMQGIAPGMDVVGAEGEKLTGFSPNIPNTEFFPHAKMILGIIAVNLGLPLQVLLLDASETNFSGWRGAVDQARIGMAALQRVMILRLYNPTFAWKMRRWLMKDTKLQGYANALAADTGLPAEVAIMQHTWRPPTWPYIEPSKDARADTIIIESHLDSRRALLAKRGLRIEEVDAQEIIDRTTLIESGIKAAAALNDTYPEAQVDWREIVGGKPLPQTAQQEPKESADAKKDR